MARTYRYGFDRFGERPPHRHDRLESEESPLWDEDLDDDDDGDAGNDDDLWDDNDDEETWDDSSYEDE